LIVRRGPAHIPNFTLYFRGLALALNNIQAQSGGWYTSTLAGARQIGHCF
jgi:hypothetical protein